MWWSLLLACAPDPEPELYDPGMPGPYAVGARTLVTRDPRGKELLIEVWYPAASTDAAPGIYTPTILQRQAVRNAAPAPTDAPWPLVAFSHGSQGIRFQSIFFTEHLASHGFVVVAPDHNGNTILFQDDTAVGRVFLERPDDVRFAVDAAIAEAAGPGILHGLIADGPYGMTGHSFGALTALVVGGGVLDFDFALQSCAAGADTRACRVITPELADQAAGYGTVDPRVVATVAMSPLAPYAFGPNGVGLQQVAAPLIIAGALDHVTPLDTEMQPVFDGLASPKQMLLFDRAAHYSFSDICLLVPFAFPECDPSNGYAPLD